MAGLERRKSDNYSLAVCGPYDVTRGQFERCAALAMTEGRNTTGNLLFPAGDDVIVCGECGKGEDCFERRSLVSFRNYCGTLEMLVTDSRGRFIVYTKLDGLPKESVIEEYWHEFELVRHLIGGRIDHAFSQEIKDNAVKGWLDRMESEYDADR